VRRITEDQFISESLFETVIDPLIHAARQRIYFLTMHLQRISMNRAATLLLALLVYSGVAQPKDLTGVFEDALRKRPGIRQADATAWPRVRRGHRPGPRCCRS